MTRPTTPSRLGALAGLALSLLALGAQPAQAGDVGVSIAFSQPGVYGRVDIGNYPQPVLIAPQPVLIGRAVAREPVYLWVPPGHRRDWHHHCRAYGACGVPVYFVEDRWYHAHVDRRYDDRGPRGPGRRDDWRDDRPGRDRDRWDDRRDDRHDHHDHRGR